MTPVERVWRDVVFGARVHARTPLMAACLIGTLALGVAATSVSFALVNALFIRPLPVREPQQLVRVYRHAAPDDRHFPLSYREYRSIRELGHPFAGGAAEEPLPLIVGAAGAYERVWGEVVSPAYFSELGVAARHGRVFDSAEDQQGDAVVVISEAFWKRRFAGDPGVLHADLRVDGRPYRIVGVVPEAFRGTVPGFTAELWLPIRSLAGREEADGHAYFTLARLARDVDVGRAQAALDALARRLEIERPATNRAVRFAAFPEAAGRVPPPFRSGFLAFSIVGVAVALLVTAVACANAAGVLLAGAAARRREIAVRASLGASRGRIVAQLLAEAAALAVPAGVAGVATAWLATRALSAVRVPIARGASLSFDFGLDARALALAVAMTLATVVLAGLAPSVEAARLDLVAALKGSSAGARHSRYRRTFLGGQVAVSMVLVAACALFIRSLQHARAIDLGFSPDGVVATAVDTRRSSAAGDPTFWRRLVEEVRRLPGVESASLTSRLPLELGVVTTSLAPEGFVAGGGGWPSVEFAVIDVGYFSTMRIGIVEGRDFTIQDSSEPAAAAIVNDVLARQFWGDRSPVGRHVMAREGGRLQIVGVVRQSKYLSVGESPKPYVYFPLPPAGADALTIVARGSGDAATLLRGIGDAVRHLDPEAPLYEVTTMSQKVATALAPASAAATAFAIVALLAVVLTALGLFGAVAQSVSRRTYEIGVRRALGAPDRSVVWLTMRDTLAPVAAGSGLGVAIVLAGQGLLRAVLYDASALDPLVVGLAPVATLLVCATAAWLPSRRATRISAAAALRSE